MIDPSDNHPVRACGTKPSKNKCGSCFFTNSYQLLHGEYNILMSELQIQRAPECLPVQNRFRTLQFKVKKPRAQLEDYDLREEIGQGGYGRVRRAIHKPTGQIVAVKVLRVDQCDPQQVQSIEGEILLQQRLMHEHIAQIYEVIRRQKKIYIFMEHCPNGELFERIVKNGPMGQKEAAKVFQQVLSALLYLKRMGVSHRDIKPENILFDGQWNAKLVDFGFSCKSFTEEEKMRKTVCGTPSYTPPQVLLKTEYSAELMDVWSLGVTLYTMLAAEMPFEGESPQKKRSKILNCRWSPKNFFSQRVQKLLNGIFIEPSQRMTLADLQASEFALSYPLQEPAYVDHTHELLVPEEGVLYILERDFGMNQRKVSQSVKSYSLDKYRAHYYLILTRQMMTKQNHLLCDGVLSKYKKQRKSSLSKLEPIVRTPVSKAKDKQFSKVKNTQNLRIRRGSVNLEPPATVRVRKERTPESPRKMMDSLVFYK